VNCEAVALFLVTLKPWGQGYKLKTELKDSSSALLKKYELDKKVLKIFGTDLAFEVAKKVHKGKAIYIYAGVEAYASAAIVCRVHLLSPF